MIHNKDISTMLPQAKALCAKVYLQKKKSAMLPQAKDDGTIYAFRSFMKIDDNTQPRVLTTI